MDTDSAFTLFCGTDKASVNHAQWLKDMLRKIVAKRLAAYRFNQLADPVRINPVFPAFTRIAYQRHTERGFFATANTRFAGCFLVLAETGIPDLIAKPGGMGQKLTGGDGSFRRAELRLAVRIKAFQHLKGGKFGHDFAQRLIKAEFPLLV